ncbi:MAG: glycoside hydrolase family 3 protein, partial [Pseudomonadota bacterium]
MHPALRLRHLFVLTASVTALMTCAETAPVGADPVVSVDAVEDALSVNLEIWPQIDPLPLDPEIEAKVDELLSKMTLEQKVGQVIQGDTNSLTAEDVKTYRLGSVLSGGNSAPGNKPYAETQAWLDAADAYYEASLDTEDIEVAIPIIWGIDAVHGHTNVIGGVVFPHNVGLGAARDPDLIRRIMEVTAVELNITGHDWTFAPTLAVPQNDRWGRGYEGFSEDPEIVKSYGGVIVEGLQGTLGSEEFMDPSHVMSTAKHFLGDGGTENGVDQGDARISEQELRDIHLPGYESAILAGTQSVMASFSSWNGVPMHGQKELMTDVLKGRMGFQGFIIGDWNGHALIPGCTATDCPQSLNAGLDMYMAPDSWKGLYESTLRHVKSGRIPMERLDDANRRILRVKLASGILDKPKPSERPLAGQVDRLGSAEHRAVAREAVRKSVVLLKNNDGTLPLDPGINVHVVGAGADSISKLSGGWTLSWQGRDIDNSEFPNGESLLTAIEREVEMAGGRVTFDPEGDNAAPDDADVIIAVYGEDPYAEFQGDRENVDFVPNDFDTDRLEALGEGGAPVVSVFVSGRPLWTNPEINDSEAFVAAFLPGSEPAGLTDLLFQTEPVYDFTGRLSFSWPKLATQVKLNAHHDGYDPQFELGYGLSFSSDIQLEELSEDSGVDGVAAQKGVFFDRGSIPQPFRLNVDETPIDLPHNSE